ncbi:MAG: hypothetical protein WC736_12780 [Gallionella sp.]|jgi:hypothetical protein
MANLNSTAPHNTLNHLASAPIAQRFIDDQDLFALARAEDCADMSDAELAAMDEQVEYQMYLDRRITAAELDEALERAVTK